MLSVDRKLVHHAELLALASLLLLASTAALGPDDAGQASAAPLSILDFGGKAAPGFNNQAAIAKAKQHKDDPTDDKKRKYNSFATTDVTAEDMEAYRRTKITKDDPMAKFLQDGGGGV